ncbi:MAG: Cof-type HAD-IIB family hydrolase [Firmicutes bacterium]|nr:Cof-type HAD-IIB family hydrolase [Bacillota bacterium]
MNKLKLIAIDIDGTLLNDEREVSRENKEAIKRAERKGIYVVLATGRMYRSAKKFENLFTTNMPLIAYNGGLIKEFNDGKVLFQNDMPKEMVKPIYEHINRYGFAANFYIDDNLYGDANNEYIHGYAEYIDVPYIKLKDEEIFRYIDEMNIIKMVAFGEEKKLDLFLEKEKKGLEDKIHLVKSLPFMLEIANKDVNKGTALANLGKVLGINASEMMGIGDNMNDEEMLDYVGNPFVMANGNELLLMKNYMKTKSNNQDGVAYAISQFL